MEKIAKTYHRTFTKKECYERNMPTVSQKIRESSVTKLLIHITNNIFRNNMKVYVNYPVMITPGVYRYVTQDLDMTVEQVPYATEDIEHRIVIDHSGLFICVQSDKAVEKLTMMRKDVLSRKVAMEKDSKLSEQLCNIISAVTCAVDQVHRHELRHPDEVIDHLRARTDIYGGLSEEVLRHVDTVLTNILCKKDQDDMDDYYSDFDLQ